MKKKALSILLAMSLMLSLLPGQALAAGTEASGAETPPPAKDGVEEEIVKKYQPEAPTLGVGVLEMLPETAQASETIHGTYGENLLWTLENGILTISGLGEMPNPRDSNSVPWDRKKSSITTVEIKAGVTSIGYSAFRDCTGLTSVTIPDGVTSIGYSAFNGCSSLTSVTMPDSVVSICGGAFQDCIGLTNVTIPNSVTSIGNSAFRDCSNLTSVAIPATASVDSYAFSGCTEISYVKLTGIGEMVSWWSSDYFQTPWNSNTSIIDIEPGVTTIAPNAFRECSSLASVAIPDSVTSIGLRAFNSCVGLTSVTIPDSVTSIGSRAFSSCVGLISVTIPSSVTSIGDSAFSGCDGLTNVTIPKNVTSLGGSAFSFCDGLTSVTIGSTNISDGAFVYCSGLTSVTILDNVTSIGKGAFEKCSNLTSVTIPDSVTSIGDNAFDNCSSLASVTIPDSVTSIGEYAFWKCSGLTSVAIFGNVTSIGERTFDGCSALTSVTIPNSVTSIGEYAFYDCTSLKDVYYAGTEEQWSAIRIGYANSSLTSATIHYNSVLPDQPPQPYDPAGDAKRAIEFVSGIEWSESEQAYDITPDTLIRTLVTGQTVLEGANSPEELRNRYVLVERTQSKAVRVKVLESGIGTVSSMKMQGNVYNYDFVIDGATYQMRDSVSPVRYTENELVGRKVLYLLADGWLVDVTKLYPNTGYVDGWEGQELSIDGKGYAVRLSGAPALEAGTIVGFSAIRSNYRDAIVEISPRSYETRTGALADYDVSSRMAVIDGTSYPVSTAECLESGVNVPSLVGKEVFFLLANGEIVHMDALENAAYRLSVSLGLYGSDSPIMCYDYKNGAIDFGGSDLSREVTLSNRMNYRFPEMYSPFYDRTVISGKSEQHALTVDSAYWGECYGLQFSGPDVKNLTLQPGESVDKTFTVTGAGGYAPKEKSEMAYGFLSVLWRYSDEEEEQSTRARFSLNIKNDDYTAAKLPQDQNKSADTAVAFKRARRELDKLGSLELDPNIMKDVFGMDGSARQRFEKELFTIIALSSVPKETFREKVTDKVLTEVFGKYRPDISAESCHVPLEYTFQTPQYGEVRAQIDCEVSDYSLSGSSIGKFVKVSYTIISNTEKAIYPKSGLLGGGVSVDVSAFFTAANSVVESELKSAFDLAWEKSADKAAAFLFSTTVQNILNAGKTSVKDITWNLLVWPSKNVKINGRKSGSSLGLRSALYEAVSPVDVFVYDENNVLCGSIENDAVTKGSEDFELSVSGGTKYITGLEDNYTVQYSAAAPGFMDVEVTEYHGVDSPFRQISHYDIPLGTGRSYEQSIAKALQQPEHDYALIANTGESIPADELADLFIMEEDTELEPLDLIGWTAAADGGTLIELVDRSDALDSGSIACAAHYSGDGRMTACITGTFEGDTVTFGQQMSEQWCVYLLNGNYHPLTQKTPLSPELRYTLQESCHSFPGAQ